MFYFVYLRRMGRKEEITTTTLLSREDFKKYGFKLTGGKCCVPGCEEDAVDAHHIMDRKLFSNGGYYLSNCAPLCAKHHIDAENGTITPSDLCEYLMISSAELIKPDKIDWLTDEEYKTMMINRMIDKWGK